MDTLYDWADANGRRPEEAGWYQTLWVCRTGEKEVFYTLYQDQVFVKPHPYKAGKFAVWCRSSFVQNLSYTLNEAIAKAEDLRERTLARGFANANIRIKYSETPRKKVEPYFDIGLGDDFYMHMNNRQTMWYAHPNEAFWDYWRENKADLKENGIWVSKLDGQWFVFRRVEEGEVMWLDDDGYDVNDLDVEVSA
tara:strand:- start:41126 stop:41707 length:582 start_codon:yes stop_codon:yes gene_type:complete